MIKIFGVGNSFTEDAHTWLKQICEANGIEVKLVCPFIGGHTLKRHLDKIESNAADYDLIIDGHNTGKKVTFMEAFEMEEWDIVTFNQGSVQAGRPFTYYPYINQLRDIVLKHSPNAKLYIYQTWAYESDATHPYYPVYNCDQREMHVRTRDCYKMAAKLIDVPIIPVGDVIQYLRENVAEFDYKNGGMSLNRDGYHLTELYGRYAAGLTFYRSLFNGDIINNEFLPFKGEEVADKGIIEKIKQAVVEIVDRPLEEDDL